MIFAVENGSYSYKKSLPPLLNNISFAAETGDLIAILGPNGAGKTTLLRCAMGFLSWSEGRTLLGGKDIKSLSRRELWQSIAYVPQSRGSSSSISVREMVLLGRGSRIGALSSPGQGDLIRAEEIMEMLGISAFSDALCNEISGGELQMTLIARALAAEPRLLILDEPESNLDFKNQLIVLDTMSALCASGLTCIFNTHYPAHAMRRANKSMLLDKSGNFLFGATDSVVTEANIERAFGVKAVISDIETPVNITRDVVPVMLSVAGDSALSATSAAPSRQLATISIISTEPTVNPNINSLLREYGHCIIGRMGMPYLECGINIINVNLDAEGTEIEALTRALGTLSGVSVKATYAKISLPPHEG